MELQESIMTIETSIFLCPFYFLPVHSCVMLTTPPTSGVILRAVLLRVSRVPSFRFKTN